MFVRMVDPGQPLVGGGYISGGAVAGQVEEPVVLVVPLPFILATIGGYFQQPSRHIRYFRSPCLRYLPTVFGRIRARGDDTTTNVIALSFTDENVKLWYRSIQIPF